VACCSKKKGIAKRVDSVIFEERRKRQQMGKPIRLTSQIVMKKLGLPKQTAIVTKDRLLK
jgi:hypothetical protein